MAHFRKFKNKHGVFEMVGMTAVSAEEARSTHGRLGYSRTVLTEDSAILGQYSRKIRLFSHSTHGGLAILGQYSRRTRLFSHSTHGGLDWLFSDSTHGRLGCSRTVLTEDSAILGSSATPAAATTASVTSSSSSSSSSWSFPFSPAVNATRVLISVEAALQGQPLHMCQNNTLQMP